MFIGKCVGTFNQVVECVDTNRVYIIAFCIPDLEPAFAAYFNIADIYLTMKLWKINIKPIGIFGLFGKQGAVLYYFPIDRIFERIGEPGSVEYLVGMGREIDLI